MSKKTSEAHRLVRTLISIALYAILVMFVALAASYFHNHPIAVLSPKGVVATKQFHLILLATGLSLTIIVPVFVMTFVIVRKYRVDSGGNHRHKKTRYAPDWDHDRRLEVTWWGVPTLLILILAVITVRSSHSLDPFKPIASRNQPITIQVVALQWKWLFIYPQQGIASVNYVEFPADTPVNFQITADAPMNSLWIPQLGGQVYAMSGMSTQLHLMADEPGDFRGVSANLSGSGFSGMDFKARAVPSGEFGTWVKNVKNDQDPKSTLDVRMYNQLAQPSKNMPPTFYSLRGGGLYDTVIMKYMMPLNQQNQQNNTSSRASNMSNTDSANTIVPGMSQMDGMPGMGSSQDSPSRTHNAR